MEKNEIEKNKNHNLDKDNKNFNYYDLLEEFENNEGDNPKEKSKNVPPIIVKIWGNVSEEKFNKLKNNSSWLELTVNVCTDCYLKFTKM